MKNQKIIIAFVACIALSVLQSCICGVVTSPDVIIGSGEMSSRIYSPGEFTKIENHTVCNVEIVQGDISEVEVSGYENLLDYVNIEVINGRLKIDMKRGRFSFQNMNLTVYVQNPQVESLTVHSTGNMSIGTFKGLTTFEAAIHSTGNIIGSGYLDVDGNVFLKSNSTGNIDLDLDARNIESFIEGTGNITLAGNCIDEFVRSNSVGLYTGYDLLSENCTVESQSIGDVRVQVKTDLNVSIESIGSVYYKGNPKNVYSRCNSLGKLYEVE
jgi:hypothetical protein